MAVNFPFNNLDIRVSSWPEFTLKLEPDLDKLLWTLLIAMIVFFISCSLLSSVLLFKAVKSSPSISTYDRLNRCTCQESRPQ